jgi:hypothetical protein
MARGDDFIGPPEPPPPPDVKNALDTPREYLSGKIVDYVGSVDRFFGDDRNYQETNDSVFQLDLTRVSGYDGDNKFVLSGRAKIHLPIAEQRLHLLVETNPDKNATVDPTRLSTAPIKASATPASYAAALRYEKAEAERMHFSVDAGIKLQGLNSTPFTRARASLAIPYEGWRLKAAESLFWFNTIGAGETTQVDFEHQISEPLLFRSTSNATWLNDLQNFDLRQDLSVFHKLDDRSVLLYQASVIGMSHPKTQVSEYIFLMLYRYRIHREWVFVEFSPQLHFPIERNFKPSPVFSARLELLFDESNK